MKMIKNHERRNICGKRLREIRKSRELSQENVAAMIQLEGLDLTKKRSAEWKRERD